MPSIDSVVKGTKIAAASAAVIAVSSCSLQSNVIRYPFDVYEMPAGSYLTVNHIRVEYLGNTSFKVGKNFFELDGTGWVFYRQSKENNPCLYLRILGCGTSETVTPEDDKVRVVIKPQ